MHVNDYTARLPGITPLETSPSPPIRDLPFPIYLGYLEPRHERRLISLSL